MLKIAFLFLTIGNVYHEAHWQDFLRGNEDQYSVYVHAKKRVAPDSWFYPFQLEHTRHTSWGHTMRAQIQMLKQALHDPLNEKFVFLSESTLPLQNFETTYRTLMVPRKSFFRYERNPHPHMKNPSGHDKARNIRPLPLNEQYKNTQWIVLDRAHAQLMVEDDQIIDIATWYICDNEHYPATFLARNKLLDEVVPQDMTCIIWHSCERPPYVFTDLADEKQFELLRNTQDDGYLFVRKVDKGCNLVPFDTQLAYRTNNALPKNQVGVSGKSLPNSVNP